MKVLAVFSWMIVCFLWTPLLWIAYRASNVEAFTRLMSRDDILSSASQSMGLAFSTAIISTVLGTVTAFALPELPKLKRTMVDTGLVFPMVLPEIAMGLGFMVWFIKIGWSFGWLTLISSHIAFCFSFSTLIMKTRVEALDFALVDAAKDLGASRFHVLRHAVIPQLAPGLLASFLTCFSLSLDDFLISFFVKGLSQMTLPIQVYSMMKTRIGPEIYALSLILFCISLFAVLVSQLWFKTKPVSR